MSSSTQQYCHIQVTYDNAEVYPGPNLNLVVGPNGTGKSTLVSALCLGLGGTPATLGRAADLQEFIKHAATDTFIQITLSGGPGEDDVVLKRAWRVEPSEANYNKSKWYIDGRSASKREYDAMLRQFDIQVNNLTQFLPQDRVSQFAALSPTDLLRETEKAVGQDALLAAHEKLVTLIKEERELTNRVNEMSGIHTDLSKQNEALQRDVQRHKARKAKLERSKKVAAHAEWLAYDEAKVEMRGTKALLKQAKAQLATAKAVHSASSAGLTVKATAIKLETSTDLADQHEANTMRQMNRVVPRFIQKDLRGGVPQAEFHNIETEFRDAGKETKHCQEELRLAKNGLKSAQDALKSKSTIEDFQAELEGVVATIQERYHALEIAQENEEKALADFEVIKAEHKKVEAKLAVLKKTGEKQVAAIGKLVQSVPTALKQLNGMRAGLKGRVWAPLAKHITVVDPEWAGAVEAHLGPSLGATFLFENHQDMLSFREEMLAKHKGRGGLPPLAFLKHVNGDLAHAPLHGMELQRLRGHCFMGNMVTSEEHPVKLYLQKVANIHSTVLGLAPPLNQAMQTLVGKVSKWYTKDSVTTWYKSPYTHETVSTSAALQDARWLTLSQAELEAQTALTQELVQVGRVMNTAKEKHTKENGNKTNAVMALGAAKKAKDEVLKAISVKKKGHAAVKKAEKKLETVEHRYAEAKAAQKETRAQITARVEEHFDDVLDAITNTQPFENLVDAWAGAVKNRVAADSFGGLHDLARDKEAQTNDAAKAAEAEVDTLLEKILELETRGANLKAVARAKWSRKDLTFVEEEKDMPLDPEECKKMAEELEAEATLIFTHNPDAVKQFHARQQRIDDIVKSVTTDRARLHQVVTMRRKIAEAWTPRIRAMVGALSRRFTSEFAALGLIGEVGLTEAEDSIDYDKYGIEIRVKFRNGQELSVLSATRHSGGEKSVSTMVYLTCLQGITPAAVRVVDEINQGMDPLNERAIFNGMVAAGADPLRPQYFIVTPKLLPGLDYGPHMRVLAIHNGPKNIRDPDWDVYAHIRNGNSMREVGLVL